MTSSDEVNASHSIDLTVHSDETLRLRVLLMEEYTFIGKALAMIAEDGTILRTVRHHHGDGDCCTFWWTCCFGEAMTGTSPVFVEPVAPA